MSIDKIVLSIDFESQKLTRRLDQQILNESITEKTLLAIYKSVLSIDFKGQNISKKIRSSNSTRIDYLKDTHADL